jgi:hypothetical protein
MDVTDLQGDSRAFIRTLQQVITESRFESNPLDNVLFTYWNEAGHRFFYGATGAGEPVIQLSVRSVANKDRFALVAASALVCVYPMPEKNPTNGT